MSADDWWQGHGAPDREMKVRRIVSGEAAISCEDPDDLVNGRLTGWKRNYRQKE